MTRDKKEMTLQEALDEVLNHIPETYQAKVWILQSECYKTRWQNDLARSLRRA